MAEKRRVLAGRYEIGSAVGQGGMAKVFRATDEVLGRTVAVKVLAPEFARDQQFVERFRREAQAAAALNHPNIVSVFDTGSENGVHFIVMEYLEGRTLREVLSQEGPLHPDRAAEVAESISNALGSAHQQNLVHRDIKPGNIMLTPSGDVKVMDFGIARATTGEALTQTATVLGTASYFSPEQAKGEPVDQRSDIYSVGCVLYELVTGRAPFTGDSPVAIAYKHVREAPVLPSSINPDVPPALEAVIMKALAKNPANRYQRASEMAADLARVRQGLPVAATPILPGETTQVVTRAQPADGTAVMAPLDEEPDRRGNKTWLIVLASALILGLLGLAAVFLIRELTASEPLVGVPRVVGLTEEQATRALRQRAFRVRVERAPNQADEGIVFDQLPKPNEQAEEGGIITIFVSQGPQPVAVPTLVGKPLPQAQAEIVAAGFRVGEITREETDEADPGIVLDQNPNPDALAKPGRKIDLVVARESQTRIVPNVVCEEPDVAEERLADQDLRMRTRGEEFSDACAEGTIARQDPEQGAEVEAGSRVRVWISRGPEEDPSPIVTTPTP
ncbi:MAG TPA: Stk1 family PASTA domain-containing Ser/Thr kinase [Actinomycetota bacterium]|nr:Stk1 family PASTA domain-containing Ser/Thr kinase [Actinomycetota bacterium]